MAEGPATGGAVQKLGQRRGVNWFSVLNHQEWPRRNMALQKFDDPWPHAKHPALPTPNHPHSSTSRLSLPIRLTCGRSEIWR